MPLVWQCMLLPAGFGHGAGHVLQPSQGSLGQGAGHCLQLLSLVGANKKMGLSWAQPERGICSLS